MAGPYPSNAFSQSKTPDASPNTPQSASGQFKTNVNRVKSKRWVEAKSYAYDGDDWGEPDDDDEEGDYEETEPPPRTTGLRQRGQGVFTASNASSSDDRYGEIQGAQPTPRNVSTPIASAQGRASFDQSEDRRAFSSGLPGQCPPQPQHPQQPQYRPATSFSQMNTGRPPLQVETQSRRSMEQQNQPRGPPYGPPYTAGPRSRSNDRSSPAVARPSNSAANSVSSSPSRQDPSARFPPRKSSLSQQTPPVIPMKEPSPSRSDASANSTEPQQRSGANAAKPLPFIRPADIYKRMAEEQEKERRSQESSRPSMDSQRAQSREQSPSNHALRQRTSSESVGRGGRKASIDLDDSESGRRLKPMLDPVAERKSEYGFENLMKNQGHDQQPVVNTSNISTQPKDSNAERLDLPSASSNYSERSLEGSLPDINPMPGFHVDFVDQSQKDTPQPQPSEPAAAESDLRHQPSQGYRSAVKKAFEDERQDIPTTPSSLGRSNSDSASAISPVISRGPMASFATDAPPTIQEEPERSGSRPGSSGTIEKTPTGDSKPLPPPRRGLYRNTDSPSPGSSPARQPIVKSAENHKSEEAEMSSITPSGSQSSLVGATPHDNDKALPNLPTLAARESPVPRAESPPKGTVRGLTGQFDQGSGTQRTFGLPTNPRPEAGRSESFRPKLPGGWESFATTPDNTAPPPEPRAYGTDSFQGHQSPDTPRAPAVPEFEQEATPPVARPAEPMEGEKSNPDPFARATAAGSALASALVNTAGGQVGRLSDGERRRPPPGENDRLNAPTLTLPESGGQSSASSMPPTPPPKDGTQQHESPERSSYFPPPLRHRASPSLENVISERPRAQAQLSIDTSPKEGESDRLREEIINTLTPQRTETEIDAYSNTHQNPQNLDVAPTSRDQVESMALPREYESYWEDTANGNSSVSAEKSGPPPTDTVPGMPDAPEAIESPRPQPGDIPPDPSNPQAAPESSSQQPILSHKFSWETSQQSLSSQPLIQKPEVRIDESPSEAIHGPPRSTTAHFSEQPYANTDPVSPMASGDEPGNNPDHHDQRQITDSFGPPQESSSHAPTIMPTYSQSQQVSPLNPEFTYSTDSEPITSGPPVPIQADLTPQSPTIGNPVDNAGEHDAHPPIASDPPDLSFEAGQQFAHLPSASVSGMNEGNPLSPSSPSTEVLSFRKILALRTPGERITAYNHTREQFYIMDTGLQNWIASTGELLPEHEGVMFANGRPISDSGEVYRPSPGRSRFPKIPGMSFDAGDGNRPSHHRQISGSFGTGKISSHQVQAMSKDLLHSAGVIGGKAGGAAKGWLAKSKTRFRSSGGGDKAISRKASPLNPHTSESGSVPKSPSRPTLGSHVSSFSQDGKPSSLIPTDPSFESKAAIEPLQAKESQTSVSHSISKIAPGQSPGDALPEMPLEKPLRDSTPAPTESNQGSKENSVNLARQRSAASNQIPYVNVDTEHAKSEVSAMSEETPLEDTSHTQHPAQPTTETNLPVQAMPDNGTIDASRRISISPIPSPVVLEAEDVGNQQEIAPRESQTPLNRLAASQEPHNREVSHQEPLNQEAATQEPLEFSRQEAEGAAPEPEKEHPVRPTVVVPRVPTRRDYSKNPDIPQPSSEEQERVVREFMRPEDFERITRGPQFVSNLPQYEDHRRRTNQSRPFSFVGQSDEEVLQKPGQAAEGKDVSRSPEEDLKELEDELSRGPRSSRHFQEPNIDEHPAFKEETSPHGGFAPQMHFSPQPMDPSDEADRMRFFARRETLPRQGDVEYQLPGVGPPQGLPARPPQKLTKTRSDSRPRSGLFRSRSKTRDSAPPSRDQETPDTPAHKKRSSIFSALSKNETVSDRDSIMANAATSRPASRLDLMMHPQTSIPANYPSQSLTYPPANHTQPTRNVNISSKDKPKETKKAKKLQRSSTSNVIQDINPKKKRFSGLSSLFGRSGTTGHADQTASPNHTNQQIHPHSDYRIPHPPQPSSNFYASQHPSRQDGPRQDGSRHGSMQPQMRPPQGYPTQGLESPQQYPSQQVSPIPTHRYAPPQASPYQQSAQPFSSQQSPSHHSSVHMHSPPQQSPYEKSSQYFPAWTSPEFQGQPPPPGGYYAPQNRRASGDFIGGRRLSEQRVREAKHDFESQNAGFRGPLHPPPAPHGYQQQRLTADYPPVAERTPISPATSLRSQNYPTSPSTYGARSPYSESSAQVILPASEDARYRRGRPGAHSEYVRDLSRRSRSPKSQGYHSAHDYPDERYDPAEDLGTFRTHIERSSDKGGQEGPWRLAIPEEEEQRRRFPLRDIRNDRRLSRLDSEENYPPSKHPLPDSAKDITSPVNPAATQMPPPPPPKIPLSQHSTSPQSSHRQSASQNGLWDGEDRGPPVPEKDDPKPSLAVGQQRSMSPVELDARPTKDTESEEIVMSSTAYPGQEWMPENWGHWDAD